MNKIDDILKQQMENFAPDAPNIWAGIEQGIQANAASQTAIATKNIGSKLVITIAKFAVILAIPASVMVYFASNEKTNYVENPKEVNNNLLPNPNTENVKTFEIPEITSVNTENKSLKIRESKTEFSNNNTPSNSLEKTNYEIVSPNEQNAFEQLNISKKSKNEKLIIVSNDKNNDILEEEIIENTEVEMIEENEIKVDFSNAGKESGIRVFPNVFTPNNDGIDDKYVIDLEGEKFYNLKIYNYNNELVFESEDKNNNWDGNNYKTGQACNSGTYYGIFQFKLINENKNSTRMTKIKLIR